MKDYLACPKRFWYRANRPETAKLNKHVVFGSIVHEAIELIEQHKYLKEVIQWSEEEWDKRSGSNFAKGANKPPKSFSKMLTNYFDKIRTEFPKDVNALVEHFFDIKWNDKVNIVGKIDYIAGHSIYDWKSGARKPSPYQLQDLQFYVYEWAYRELYGREPKVYYGFLNEGELLPVEIKDELKNTLPIIIDRIIEDVDKIPYRVAGYQCRDCFYREICYSEMDFGTSFEY